jgi:tetratricopeptide (TPR) repeat protein
LLSVPGAIHRAQGRLNEAMAEYRKAIDLDKNHANTHNNLGNAFRDTERFDEAIAEYRKAIDINKDFGIAHYNLANVLTSKGRLDEAIAEYREALRLVKNDFGWHHNFGIALFKKGMVDQAMAEFRTAIEIRQDQPEPHFALGSVFRQKGQFAAALVEFNRGQELATRNPRWPHPTAQLVRECERLVELDRKLAEFRNGKWKPAAAADCLALAEFGHLPCKNCQAATARLFALAFTLDPKLAAERPSIHRYHAACVAALAGCRQGQDAKNLDEKECGHFRREALHWLRAELTTLRKLLDQRPDQTQAGVARRMLEWLKDTDFASVRGPAALAKLPQPERQDWRQLWLDVEQTLAKARETPKKP